MRKFSAVLSVTALALLTLAGCAPAPGTANASGCTPAGGDDSTLKLVTTTGDLGGSLQITAPAGLTVKDAAHTTPIMGTGEQITDANQIIKATVTVLNTADSSTFPLQVSKLPYTSLTEIAQFFPDAPTQLLCATAGSRVVLGVPASSLNPQDAQQLGLKGVEGLVAVVDIQEAMLPHAEGSDVFNSAWGMPSIVRAPDGRPGVVVPSGNAPTKPVIETVIKGSGPIVKQDEIMFAQQTVVSWSTHQVTSSTWDNGTPFLIHLASKQNSDGPLPAVFSQLKDVTVGSQIMIVDPSDGDAQIYVIDVTGAVPAK